MNTPASAITARTLRDLANGLQQQMFFLGQDILHPRGNFMVEQGFKRRTSTGLKATSCYYLEWQDGHLELYGSYAGWYAGWYGGELGRKGFTFIRPQRKCVIWNSVEETPVPGKWQSDHIFTEGSRADLYRASLPFLDWLISYETAVIERLGPRYRSALYALYLEKHREKAWVEPATALHWFQSFRHTPSEVTPAKRLAGAVLTT